MWSLYLKVERRYVRISESSYTKATAVRVFQTALLGFTMQGYNVSLQKVKDSDKWADVMLVPSYGRSYESAEQVEADWESGKDFTVKGKTAQCNKADAKQYCKGNCVLVFFGDQVIRIDL